MTCTRSRHFTLSIAVMAVALPLAPAAADDCGDWQPYTQGLNFTAGETHLGPHATTIFNGDLVIAGWFETTAQGVTVNNIARFDGLSLLPLGSSLEDGTNHTIMALTIFEDDLIAGGAFTLAGGVPASGVARWDGAQWHAVGEGVPVDFPFSVVHALTVHNGELYAGMGSMPQAGAPGQIYRWDGSTWANVGSASHRVRALLSFDGELIAGGDFTSIDGVEANRVARWDGAQWHAMGSGTPGIARCLMDYDGHLLAGGNLGTVVAMQWGGGAWSPVGLNIPSGIDVYDLLAYDDELIAVGLAAVRRLSGLDWQQVGDWNINYSRAGVVHEDRLIVVGGFKWTQGDVEASGVRSVENCRTGACCAGGGCLSLWEDQCLAIGGEFHGMGVSCDDASCSDICSADLDGDGNVGIVDLLILLDSWGPCP
jgi:hypothetical protein